MFFRALLAFLALPGVVAFLIPPLVAFFDPWKKMPWIPGLFVTLVGLAILLWCVRDFYVIGKGTLAPWDPPKHLMVLGLYRYTRNPMYIGVLLLVLGWGLYFMSPALFAYLVILAVAFHLRVLMAEEPWLKATFGEAWEQYRQNVPRWLPRKRSWSA